jgi:hypothetical protein
MMSYFDARIGRCEALHTMVLTDQTNNECKREHGCSTCTQALDWAAPYFIEKKIRVVSRSVADPVCV